MTNLRFIFVGLLLLNPLMFKAQENDCSQFMQYFEAEDYNTVITSLLECINDDTLNEIERKKYEFYLQMSYGLIEDYANFDALKLEDITKDDLLKNNDNILLSYVVLTHYYKINQNYNKAIEINEKLISIAKKNKSVESEVYAMLLQHLANLYGEIGDYSKTLELGQQVLNIREKQLGENHPDYATSLNNLALYYSYLGDYSKAIELGEEALTIRKKVLGENHPDYATSLGDLAGYYFSLGDYSKAKDLEDEALKIREKISGVNHPDYAVSLSNLARIYSLLGDYSKAIELGEDALTIRKKVLGENHPDYATSLGDLAGYYFSLGDYSKAKDLEDEALKIREKISGVNHPDYAVSLSNLARIYSLLGDYSKAIELGEEALTIRKKVLGENHPNYATSLNNLALYYSYLGDYSKAIELGEEALNIQKKVFGENHPDYATLLNNLAYNYFSLGDYSRAVALGEEALIIQKIAKGVNHPEYATSLVLLAKWLYSLGDYSKAIALGEEALNIRKKVLGETHPDYAQSLNNMANNYSSLGDYFKGIELMEEALNIRKKVLGETHPGYATSLINMANNYYSLGDYFKGIELMEEALNIRKVVLGETHPDYAQALSSLAQFYSSLGDYSKAIELGEEALNTQKKVLGENHPDYALSLNNLANNYSSLGDYYKSIAMNEEALIILRNSIGYYHPFYAILLNNLARYYRELGDYSKAIELGEEALIIQKNILGENHPDYILTLDNLAVSFLYSNNFIKSSEYLTATFEKQKVQLQNQFGWLTENERSLYWYKEQDIFLLTPSFSYLSGNISQFVNLSYDGALLSKALMLNSSIELNNLLMETGNEKVIDKVSRLRTLHHTLNKLYEKPISERHLDTDSLEEVSQKLERELLSESKEYGDYTRFMSVTWQDVQKRLEVQDVAIEFVEFPVLKSDSVMYAALVLRKDWEQPQMIPLFEKRDLEKFLAQTPDRLYSGYVGKQLYRLMWKPLEGVVKKGDNVYFSAAGVYYQLALEYLPSDDDIPLCDKYNFRRLSSTRQLALDQQEATNGNATLYGGIEYDVNPLEMVVESKRYRQDKNLYAYRGVSMDSLREGSWVSLDNTVPEIEFISDELNKSQIEARIFTGVKANEESIKALSGKRTSILHLATHGFFLPVEETRRINYFQMLGKENNAAPDMSMRRSGLIMAGGNRAWSGDTIPEGIDDGILTAQEISVLDFRGMDLVVLSACETGLGDINGSEGVFGLQRAFKKAGASTLVMSLWKVNDQVTRLLMGKFYQGLMEGKTKHAAFLEAQQLIRSRHPEPQNWAAFVMLD